MLDAQMPGRGYGLHICRHWGGRLIRRKSRKRRRLRQEKVFDRSRVKWPLPGVAVPAKQTLASVASEQVGSRQRPQHLLQLLWQQPLAFRLQVLEIRIPRNGRIHRALTA